MTSLKIKTADFVKSSSEISQYPKADRNEFAFIGRSNVGKSSLINMLMQRKSLAKISSTPGKTSLVNHFNINDEWFLVDLPGYGYAKRSKVERKQYSKIIKDYIMNRENLLMLFVLIDFRIPPQKNDLEFIDMLGEEQIPFCLIFTKYDKLRVLDRDKNLNVYLEELSKSWDQIPEYFISSANTSFGRDELLKYVTELNKNYPYELK
jgi:GTP-binding protein